MEFNEKDLLSFGVLCYLLAKGELEDRERKERERLRDLEVVKGMNEKDLLAKCEMYGLSDIETKVLFMYYVERYTRNEIGIATNYSEDNISKIKKRALDKMKA